MKKETIAILVVALFLATTFAATENTAAENKNDTPCTETLDFSVEGAIDTLNQYKKEGCSDSTWENNTLTLNGIGLVSTAHVGILLPENSTVSVNVDSEIIVAPLDSTNDGIGISCANDNSKITGKGKLTVEMIDNTAVGTKSTHMKCIKGFSEFENCNLELILSGTNHSMYAKGIECNGFGKITNSNISVDNAEYGIDSDLGGLIEKSTITITNGGKIGIECDEREVSTMTIDESTIKISATNKTASGYPGGISVYNLTIKNSNVSINAESGCIACENDMIVNNSVLDCKGKDVGIYAMGKVKLEIAKCSAARSTTEIRRKK